MKKLTIALALLALTAPAQLMAKSADDLVDDIIRLHLAPLEILHETVKKTNEINRSATKAFIPHVTVTHNSPRHHRDHYDNSYYDRRTVKKVQRQLRSLGYYPYKADGIIGFHTRKALRKYQRHHHLAVTGALTPMLIDHMFHPRPVRKHYDKGNRHHDYNRDYGRHHHMR